MKLSKTSQSEGSITIMVVLTFTILSMIVASTVLVTMNNYKTVTQAGNWQEALLASESGVDTAMCELRKTLSAPTQAFSGWSTTGTDGQPLANGGKRYVGTPITHGGEGTGTLNLTVTVESPSALIDASGRQWYRIRSTGTTYLAGAAHVTGDKRDHALRRLSFIWDRKTGQAVTRPQASRLLEVISQPVAVESALVAKGLITLNNYHIVIDSYDSRDPNKSTNGSYDGAKRQQNGDIATNGDVIEANDAYIYGDASTNAGTIIGAAHISGQQRTDFYKDLIPVQKPTWTNINASPNTISSETVLVGGTQANPQRYKVADIKEVGNKNLNLAPSAPGVESYIEIWVTGDIDIGGQGQIILQPNVHAKIYVEGNMKIDGNGFINETSRPPYLEILGIQPADGSSRSMVVTGDGSFVGAIYAPDHDVTLSDNGVDGRYYGGIIAKTITMKNHTSVHFDEALADAPFITDFKIASWFEDNK